MQLSNNKYKIFNSGKINIFKKEEWETMGKLQKRAQGEMMGNEYQFASFGFL